MEQNYNECGKRDLNPRTPMRLDSKSSAFTKLGNSREAGRILILNIQNEEP